MKSTPSLRLSIQNKTRSLLLPVLTRRLFLLTLVSFIAVAALLGIAASAKKANRAAKARAELAANSKSAINPIVQNDKQPLAPAAVVITATLTDNTAAATKVAPGGTINYTAVITNSGLNSPADDASNLSFSAPLDANTTLVAGSVHASPIAFSDTYNWVGNTFLDTSARALPAVTVNDVAVNAPGGTDTFTVTAIAGGATALGGVVTLASPSGHFTYTPPLGRPTLADGATVQDSFTYTITNNADASLVSTGTVRINLTGRVWYLVAGGVGDGRSNTPSGSPSAMSTAADKSTDIFYIFSNAGSLNGPFTLETGQQLLGSAVNLVVSSITLFTPVAPTPTTTNTAGSCVNLLAGSNNTLSGFNIGTCTGGTAIVGTNVGTLTVNTLSINTNGGGLNLTGVGAPTVSVVLGELTSTGGTKNVNLVGLNGTVTLASGALSGASGNAFDVTGAGTANISYSGTISNTAAARLINISNKTGGTVAFSGALSGTTSSTGINLTTNTGTTINFTGGINLNAPTAGFTATGGGTVTATQNNTTIVNTINTTTGTALNVASTTIGGSGLTFRSISSNGAANGIILNSTGAGALTVSGNGGTCTSAGTCTGGAIQNAAVGISLTTTTSPSFDRMLIQTITDSGVSGVSVTNFTFTNGKIDGAGNASFDSAIAFNGNGTGFGNNIAGTLTITGNTLTNSFYSGVDVQADNGTVTNANISNNTITATTQGLGINFSGTNNASTAFNLNNATINQNNISNIAGTGIQAQCSASNTTGPGASCGVPGDGTKLISITNNSVLLKTTAAQAITVANSGGNGASRTKTNFLVQCNGKNTGGCTSPTGTALGSSSQGTVILIGNNGFSDMTGIVNNNAIVATHTPNLGGGNGIAGGNGVAGAGNAWTPQLTLTVTNNTLSGTDGNGILLVGRGTSGFANMKISNNTVGAPVNAGGTARQGIRVDAGNASSADDGVCVTISSNTSAGSNGAAGIGIRKEGAVQTTNDFGITGLAPSPTTGANAATFVATQNPGSTGGCNNISGASNNFQSCGTAPAIANPADEGAMNMAGDSNQPTSLTQTKSPMSAMQNGPIVSLWTLPIVDWQRLAANAKASVSAMSVKQVAITRTHETRSDARLSHHAVRSNVNVSPSVPNAPLSGEVVTLNTITTFPAGKSITIKYAATVNTPPLARQVSTQGTVSGGNFSSVLTDDPDVVGTNQPTVTLIDTTATWSGANSTDWNVDTNWTQGFVPNSVSDVIIPNAGVTNEPNTISMDVNVFTLDLQSARTLTINTGRTLTVNGGLTTLAGALAGGPYTLNFVGLTINHAAGITLNGPTSVSGVLTLTSGNVTTGANVLTIGSAGSIVRTSGHIIGSLKKTTVAAAFVFTVGTVNGYTPVNLTAPSGGGDLTVTTVGAAQPTLQANNPGKSLTEYWTLTKAGTLTASLVFNYLQSDVPGTSNEANYRIIRVVGTETASFPQNCPTTSCVDTAANTATIGGVSNFSDWTVGEVLAPTASGGVVTGRIVDANGAPVEGAVVRLNGTQNRKFITDANGFYRFDNVETNGFYTVTPSRANYEFNPTTRSFSQIGETTEATFGATLTSDSNFINPLDTPEYFVRQHYLDFLGREPDEAGFNFWSDQILECGTDTQCVERRRENVSAAYFLSIEFQETGGLVDGLYRASYAVRPQFAEFIPDTRAVAQGVVVGQDGWQAKLQANKEAFVAAFVNRPTFVGVYGNMDNSLFVDTLISHTGVSFTAAERDALVSGLANGTLTRAAVLQSIAESQRFVNAKFNDAFVMMEYFGYLRRDADASGFAFWLNKLNEFGGNFEQAEMVTAFIVSSEYRGRFPK